MDRTLKFSYEKDVENNEHRTIISNGSSRGNIIIHTPLDAENSILEHVDQIKEYMDVQYENFIKLNTKEGK